MSRRVHTWRVWRAPLALGVVSFAGLIAALLSRDVSDIIWTVAAAAPLAAITVYLGRSS